MIYLILLLVLALAGCYFFEEYSSANFACIISVIALIILIICGSVIYFTSIADVAEMEAFQENTFAVYEYIIDESENITINAIKDIKDNAILDTGNLAYFELAKSVNNNLVTLRESIRIYNTRLYTYQKYNAIWFTESFVCDVPEYLKPIKMK